MRCGKCGSDYTPLSTDRGRCGSCDSTCYGVARAHSKVIERKGMAKKKGWVIVDDDGDSISAKLVIKGYLGKGERRDGPVFYIYKNKEIAKFGNLIEWDSNLKKEELTYMELIDSLDDIPDYRPKEWEIKGKMLHLDGLRLSKETILENFKK